MKTANGYPVTPDGRYFVVRGRLWRCTNPGLSEVEAARLRRALMQARGALGNGMLLDRAAAHLAVDEAKVKLGERGPVWWRDGAPDFNRHMVDNTPYAGWWRKVGKDER